MKKNLLVVAAVLALSACSVENPFKDEVLTCTDSQTVVDGKCVDKPVADAKPVVQERTFNTVETSFKSYLEALYSVQYLKLYCETGNADGDQRQSCTATFDSGRERHTVKAQCYADGSGCA